MPLGNGALGGITGHRSRRYQKVRLWDGLAAPGPRGV